MPQISNMKLKGLYTHQNPLSEVPEGALVEAKNVVMDKEGIIETRRGFNKYGDSFTLAEGEKFNKLFSYKNSLIVSYADKMAYDSDNEGAWVNYSGTYEKPSDAVVIHSLESNGNFYFSTSSGVKKLDQLNGTIINSGGIKALDGTATLTGASGFLNTDNQVAYRIVWGYEDANGNLILGVPSQRITAVNSSGGSRDISLTFTIPDGITTSYFYQIYRSAASGGASIPADDEMGLVIENNPTSGEITAQEITLTDSTPEDLRGATIYTAPSQQGILQANDPPSLCTDMALYKNHTFYANTTNKQRLYITLISVNPSGGSTNGLEVGDSITIGGVLYDATSSENPAAGEFKVYDTDTPAENIENTALSLVRVINKYAPNTVYYAYYVSGFDDLPGKILIEERGLGGSSFAAVSNRSTCWNPPLPSSGTSISSTNERKKNRIYISKSGQPEAVPILNNMDIGTEDAAILRVIKLRDSLFVLKEDGVFRITGESISTFTDSTVDSTVILLAPETAIPFNNQIFAYTNQGCVAISDSGVAIMSRPIEIDLLEISTFPDFNSVSFGVSYESDRKYFLFVQKSSDKDYVEQAYVYNSICEGWTRWERNFSCGFVNPRDRKLYMGNSDLGYIYEERKIFKISDYIDDEIPLTIVSSDDNTVTLASTTGLEEGWLLKQSGRESTITDVINSTQVEVEDILNWVAGDAVGYDAIDVEIETAPQTGGNPTILKQYRDAVLFFRNANFNDLDLGIKSDISVHPETITLYPITAFPWGVGQWGTFPWGGGDPDVQVIRTLIPRNKQRCHWLAANIKHSTALDYFALAGIGFMLNPMSDKVR